ncbi:MAG: hypothetical protein GTN38_01140 [Candidatus Aenigmarchaeota archaeon]|nr:hypothetical protein [Candidatus Aenigmarchaeota archaeon]NIP40234.1 hypothetical protein [Candidatus Aenigmarchaeota archaeon]NIQ17499.1 hypothetical protein [Candidatus Aenigmarchaeota archaeon]
MNNLDEVRKIISKYPGGNGDVTYDLASEEAMNRLIKEISESCGYLCSSITFKEEWIRQRFPK